MIKKQQIPNACGLKEGWMNRKKERRKKERKEGRKEGKRSGCRNTRIDG
jgi:hypothetical protein